MNSHDRQEMHKQFFDKIVLSLSQDSVDFVCAFPPLKKNTHTHEQQF